LKFLRLKLEVLGSRIEAQGLGFMAVHKILKYGGEYIMVGGSGYSVACGSKRQAWKASQPSHTAYTRAHCEPLPPLSSGL
jgi:hypothetical protein